MRERDREKRGQLFDEYYENPDFQRGFMWRSEPSWLNERYDRIEAIRHNHADTGAMLEWIDHLEERRGAGWLAVDEWKKRALKAEAEVAALETAAQATKKEKP